MSKIYDKTNWIDHETIVDARKLNKVEDALEITYNGISDLNNKYEDLKDIISKPNLAPVLSSTHSKTSYNEGEHITIDFDVFDPDMSASLVGVFDLGSGKTTEAPVKLGKNTWDVGPLPRGNHSLYVYVKDGATVSNILQFYVSVGELTLTSRFDDSIVFSIYNDISISYNIITADYSDMPLITHILDGQIVEQKTAPEGSYYLFHVGKLAEGTHTAVIRGELDKIVYELKFTLNVIGETTTLLSTKQERNIKVQYGEPTTIEYTLATFESETDVTYLLNNEKLPTLPTIKPGLIKFELPDLDVGLYTLSIQAALESATHTPSNVLMFNINVFSDFEITKPIDDSTLQFHFDAKGKSNDDVAGRIGWIDKSPNNVKAELNNFNFISNGWEDNSLVINNGANVTIDYKPFENDIINFGGTLELVYSFTKLSNKDGRIMSCKAKAAPFEGIDMTHEAITLSTYNSSSVTFHSENIDIHTAYVFDRVGKFCYIFVDGVIVSVCAFESFDTIINNSKIHIGAELMADGTLSNFGECKVKAVRYYSRALSDKEVLNNFISTKNLKGQMEISARNNRETISRLDFMGSTNGMTVTNSVPLRAKFERTAEQTQHESLASNFDVNSALISWKDFDSSNFPAKDYNVDLYNEVGSDLTPFEVKLKQNWPRFNSYYVNSNFIDSSNALNIGIGRLLYKVYKDKLPIREGQYNIDGFPVSLYSNNEPYGVYTLNEKPDGRVYGLSSANSNNYMYIAKSNSSEGSASFKKWDDESINAEWEQVYPTDMSANEEFGMFIEWVNSASNEQFKLEVDRGNRVNKAFLIDYYIMCYVLGMTHSLAKDLVMVCFRRGGDGNTLWYPMFSNMTTAFGSNDKGELIKSFINNTIELVNPPTMRCPEDYFTGDSVLWNKTLACYQEEIKARYNELRGNRLGTGLTMDAFEEVFVKNFTNFISETMYNKDTRDKYLTSGKSYLHLARGNKVQQMRKWYKDRLFYCDQQFDFIEEEGQSAIFRTNKEGSITIRLNSEIPQRTIIDFGDGEESIFSKITDSEPVEFTYFYKDASQKDIIIYNADKINILDISNCGIISADMTATKRIKELYVSNNTALSSLDFSKMFFLQRVDMSNNNAYSENIDLSKCTDLRWVNVENTNTQQLNISNSPLIEYVNTSGTGIRTIDLQNRQNLVAVNADNMAKLESITIKAATKIVSLSCSRCFALRDLTIESCPEFKSLNTFDSLSLQNITLSTLPKYENVSFRNMERLASINLSNGLPSLTSVDLTNCSSLASLRIGRVDNLNTILLGGTALTTFDFGITLKPIINITLPNTMVTVSNLNIETEDATNMFAFRPNLKNFTGSIKTNKASGIFQNCSSLTNVPSIQLIGDNCHIDRAFSGCSALVNINFTGLVSNVAYAFDGCTKLTTIPMITFGSGDEHSSVSYFARNCTALTEVMFDFAKEVTFANLVTTQNVLVGSAVKTLKLQGMLTPSIITAIAKEELDNLQFLRNHNITCTTPLLSVKNINIFDYATTNFSLIVKGSQVIESIISNRNVKMDLTAQAFRGCSALRTFQKVTIDLKGSKTLAYLFYGCSSLVDFPIVDTSEVTNFSYVFSNCVNLTQEKLDSFNLGKVTNLDYTFENCNLITEFINDTSSVSSLIGAFKGCSMLSIVDFMTSSAATNLNYLFEGCQSLSRVNFDNFNFTGVTSATAMFKDAAYGSNVFNINLPKATNVDDIFNGFRGSEVILTCNVTKFVNAFVNSTFTKITINNSALTVLSGVGTDFLTEIVLNTPNVNSMPHAFTNAMTLKSVDFSSITSTNITMEGTFSGCSSLTNILLSNRTSITPQQEAFNECSELVDIRRVDGSYDVFPTKIDFVSRTFNNCSKLQNFLHTTRLYQLMIPVHEEENVTYENMFNNAIGPKEFQITGTPTHKTAKTVHYYGMFERCKNILRAYIHYDKGTSYSSSSAQFFKGSFEYSTIEEVIFKQNHGMSTAACIFDDTNYAGMFNDSKIRKFIIDATYRAKIDRVHLTPSKISAYVPLNTGAYRQIMKSGQYEGVFVINAESGRLVEAERNAKPCAINLSTAKTMETSLLNFYSNVEWSMENFKSFDWETFTLNLKMYSYMGSGTDNRIRTINIRNNNMTAEQIQRFAKAASDCTNKHVWNIYISGNQVTDVSQLVQYPRVTYQNY